MARPLLHDYYRSSAAYRVRILLNLKGVDYDRHSVNLATGEQRDPAYRALNPQGFVPMLEIDGQRLTQSLSILVYLDQTRPDPAFVPAVCITMIFTASALADAEGLKRAAAQKHSHDQAAAAQRAELAAQQKKAKEKAAKKKKDAGAGNGDSPTGEIAR